MSYVALANITLGSAASSVTFSSIPATFRDLVVVVNGAASNNLTPRIRLNSDSGSNYSYVLMGGDGSGPFSATATDTSARAGANTTTNGNRVFQTYQLMDYSATDKHKTILARANEENAAGTWAVANRWANTAAVTTVQVFTTANNFASGATFALYGIAS